MTTVSIVASSRLMYVAYKGRQAPGLCRGLRRNGGGRHYHLLATSDAPRACPHDFASGVSCHNFAPTFRTDISGGRRAEVILWTDIGTHHVMQHRKNLQSFGAAGRTHRLIRFNLHLLALCAMSAALCSENTDQNVSHPGGKLGVVHVNVDCGVQRRRQRARGKADARDLRRRTVTR